MKPALFIGSSTESLNVAYAIQESLERDATVTVWTQGVFKLSNSAIEDLLNVISNFDFAIFVFSEDDFATIRNQDFAVVRDNVVFEMGLFLGKLGKGRVFYLVPRDAPKFHVPSDLSGITPGVFDSRRIDNNIVASVGPFCNQVRTQLVEYVIENLDFLKMESRRAKRLIFEKPGYWEMLFLLMCWKRD